MCRRLAGNEADALDATQEALIAIARGIRRFDGRAAFSTWAYRVATNACLDELRRRQRRPTPGLPEDEGSGDGGGVGTSGAASRLLPDRLAIDAALAQLPEEFRAAVVLRDLCDLDYAEIAEALGIPPGTVRSRIARGGPSSPTCLTPGNQDPDPGRPTDHPTPGTPTMTDPAFDELASAHLDGATTPAEDGADRCRPGPAGTDRGAPPGARRGGRPPLRWIRRSARRAIAAALAAFAADEDPQRAPAPVRPLPTVAGRRGPSPLVVRALGAAAAIVLAGPRRAPARSSGLVRR